MLVVIPSVALGRHIFSLPSLVERGIAWLVPGSNGSAQPETVSEARASTPAVSLSTLVDPLATGVRPVQQDGSPVAVASQPAHGTFPATRVARVGVPAASGVAGATSSTPPTIAPAPGGASTTTAASGGSGAGSGSGGGSGGAPIAGGPISGGPVSTPDPWVSVGADNGSVGVSAGTGGGPVPVTASAGASTSGVSAGVSAAGVSAGASAPLPPVPTSTTPTPVETPTMTVAPVTTPVLTTPAVTVPTVTVTLPPVHLP